MVCKEGYVFICDNSWTFKSVCKKKRWSAARSADDVKGQVKYRIFSQCVQIEKSGNITTDSCHAAVGLSFVNSYPVKVCSAIVFNVKEKHGSADL